MLLAKTPDIVWGGTAGGGPSGQGGGASADGRPEPEAQQPVQRAAQPRAPQHSLAIDAATRSKVRSKRILSPMSSNMTAFPFQ